jgi:1,4-dihydroxy-2-naphthoate octaprenyltransferase
VKAWILETRPQFLILTVVLAFLGTVMAWHDGHFNLGFALLAYLGLLLAHISVNVLNDYFDYRSGIDLATKRTPFSGGSGMLPAKALTPRQVFWLGMGAFIAMIPIGVYFTITRGWLLLPLLLVAAICILTYSPFILKTPAPEWAAGLGLGTLPVLGAYFVQSSAYTLPAVLASVPPGFLVYNLLLLNEFPDVEADRIGHRKTLPITMGRLKAGRVYSAVTLAVYAWIVVMVALRMMPVYSLIALGTLPFAIKAIRGAASPEDMTKLGPAMQNNVLVVLVTQLLMGLGYVLATVI